MDDRLMVFPVLQKYGFNFNSPNFLAKNFNLPLRYDQSLCWSHKKL